MRRISFLLDFLFAISELRIVPQCFLEIVAPFDGGGTSGRLEGELRRVRLGALGSMGFDFTSQVGYGWVVDVLSNVGALDPLSALADWGSE